MAKGTMVGETTLPGISKPKLKPKSKPKPKSKSRGKKGRMGEIWAVGQLEKRKIMGE